MNVITCGGKVQGRLHTGDTRPDHHDAACLLIFSLFCHCDDLTPILIWPQEGAKYAKIKNGFWQYQLLTSIKKFDI
jgi:hypothetical protein